MKKFLLLVLTIIIVLFIFNVILPILKKDHKIDYNINKYKINEVYKKENKNNNYYFTITNKKDTYSFIYTNNGNKESIIKDIKLYKFNNLKCILPIYDNNKVSDIYCLDNNKQISSSYLKSNNKDFKNISKKLSKDNYKLNSLKDSDDTVTKDYISIYKNNLNNYKYVVWFYKGIYVIDKNNILKKKLLSNDNYDNKLSYLVGNYYVTINTDLDKNSIEYKEVLLYNLSNDKTDVIKLKENLSINTYINGVHNDCLYITDNDVKIQYKINPKTKKLDKIGDTNRGFKVLKNNKLITVRKNKNNIFSDSVSNKNISNLYKVVDIKKTNSSYYFITKDGSVYQVINNNYKNPILLFKFSDMEEVKIKNNYISFVSDNTIYNYSNEYGLRPIIINNELRYNSKNIYDVIKK